MLRWTIVASLLMTVVSGRAIEIPDPDSEVPAETDEQKFKRSDANHDGKLSFDEFLHMELAYETMKREEFDQFDANKDGEVDMEEYNTYLIGQNDKRIAFQAQYFGKIYDDFDRDFNMRLDEEELRQILTKRFLLKPRTNFHRIFRTFDVNGDGGLDFAEYLKFDAEVPFHEMDPIDKPLPVVLKTEKLPMMKKQKVEEIPMVLFKL